MGHVVQVSGNQARKVLILLIKTRILRPRCPLFSFAILLAVCGSQGGDFGSRLLLHSQILLEKTYKRVAQESGSKHWSTLQLSIMNNQACVLSILSMKDKASNLLKQMSETLLEALGVIDLQDFSSFFLTIHILAQDKCAACA